MYIIYFGNEIYIKNENNICLSKFVVLIGLSH